jgi:hypothetical protein
MSASTCAAAVPGEVPGESAGDAVGDGVAGMDDADAVGVGLTARRFAGWTPRFAEAPGGTLATAAWNGRPEHNPSAAGVPEAGIPDAGAPEAGIPDAGIPDAGAPDAGVPEAGAQVAGGVCRAVTFPGTGDGAGPEWRAR